MLAGPPWLFRIIADAGAILTSRKRGVIKGDQALGILSGIQEEIRSLDTEAKEPSRS